MSSSVDISNMALAHLGMKAIDSLAEGSPSSIACTTFFEPSRDSVLRGAKWPFATVSEALVLVDVEITGWDYIYLYPVNAAAVWDVYDESTTEEKSKQEFEVKYDPNTNKNVICSNLEDALVDYSYKVADSSIFDPKFVMAQSYYMAAAMAHTLTGSAEIGVNLMNIYIALESEAKRVNSAEKVKKPKQTSSYQDSRG